MSVSRARRWMQPSTHQVRLMAAGEWWDAVRVPLTLGNTALEHLGDQTGAVIKDGYGSCLYWLISPGDPAEWHLAQVKVLGPGSHVAVPPLHRVTGPGLYWQVPRHPPASGRVPPSCTPSSAPPSRPRRATMSRRRAPTRCAPSPERLPRPT
ncbi:hypothetical protein [Streptomyces sp. NPDC005485]|uniref:hypothetical protein n=1 Tax=Streptomyces sp. NPDC005485 TaxID=3155591 RepID=UPI0033A91096